MPSHKTPSAPIVLLDPAARDESGGRRVETTDRFECEKGCAARSPTRMWVDYTIFIPEPGDDDFPSGVCQLRTSLIEVLFCRPKDPSELPACSWPSRTIADFALGHKYAYREQNCHKYFFRPFHRTCTEDDITVTAGTEFIRPDLGMPDRRAAEKNVAAGFVSNFDPADMTIAGPGWLSLDRGWLAGRTPSAPETRPYTFQISAHNEHGSDTVSLTIVVEPAGPSEDPPQE